MSSISNCQALLEERALDAKNKLEDFLRFKRRGIYVESMSNVAYQITLRRTGKYQMYFNMLGLGIVPVVTQGHFPDGNILTKLTIDSSSVFGIHITLYLRNYTVIIPLDCDYSFIKDALNLDQGEWIPSKNLYASTGNWGHIRYNTGDWKIYPRKNFHDKTLLKTLKPILDYEQ